MDDFDIAQSKIGESAQRVVDRAVEESRRRDHALLTNEHIFLAFAKIPSYAAWLLDTDHTSAYQYERRVLKLLQWGEPARPWRLKTPAHVLFLPYLDRVFPDARFVMTHRDPTDVMLSVSDVYADIAGLLTAHPDLPYFG